MGKNLHKLLENFDKIFINYMTQLINNMEMWFKTKVDVGAGSSDKYSLCITPLYGTQQILFFSVLQSNKNGSKQKVKHITTGFACIQHRKVSVYIAILRLHTECTASQRPCMSTIGI